MMCEDRLRVYVVIQLMIYWCPHYPAIILINEPKLNFRKIRWYHGDTSFVGCVFFLSKLISTAERRTCLFSSFSFNLTYLVHTLGFKHTLEEYIL